MKFTRYEKIDVAQHRHRGDHVPVCLQPIIDEKIRALASVSEMDVVKKEETPVEYRQYVIDRDNSSINSKL